MVKVLQVLLMKIRDDFRIVLAILLFAAVCAVGIAAAEEAEFEAEFLPELVASENIQWIRENIQRLQEKAEQGGAKEQTVLGGAYENGWGVPQDDAEAAKWFRRAAEQGHANAKKALKLLQKGADGKK